MDLRYFRDCPGRRLEIGSGAGIIREVYPNVITSDLKVLPFVDIVLSAERLPFADNSLARHLRESTCFTICRGREIFFGRYSGC